ncbi:hypothetical protein WKU33_17005 [Oceanobacillus sp. HCA-5259]|uniref:hypothetical protein n=1 Tax=Oceanobacillus sp. HCA-5259 TaxID=3134661 RepID=UPI0030BFEBBC
MQLQQKNWKKYDHWGWKEFVLLMLVEFGLILGVVKPFIQPIGEFVSCLRLRVATSTNFDRRVKLYIDGNVRKEAYIKESLSSE